MIFRGMLARALFCGACLILQLAVLRPAIAEDRALIIGVDAYPQLPPKYQLTGAVNDAKLLTAMARDVWRFAPGQIKLLLNKQATSKGIVAAIESWLIEGTGKGDRVLITYSGHGYHMPDRSGDEQDGRDETIAASDTVQTGSGFGSMLSDDVVGALLDRLKGRDVVMIVDSCFSGTISRALGPNRDGPMITRSLTTPSRMRGLGDRGFERLRREPSFVAAHDHVIAFTSVSPTELAQEDMTQPVGERNGVFTRHFVAGLKQLEADANGNGIVTAAEMLAFVQQKTLTYCQQNACQTGMTPTLEAQTGKLARDLLRWGPSQPSKDEVVASKPDPAEETEVTDIIVQENADDVRLEILPRSKVRLGERIKVRVTSTKAGHLIVLDVRDDGSVIQLFPSKCQKPSRRLRPGAPLTMPDATYGCKFEAVKLGKGKILAIVSRDNVAVDHLLNQNRGLVRVSKTQDYLTGLAQKLMAVWTGDRRNRSVRWSLATADYVVEK